MTNMMQRRARRKFFYGAAAMACWTVLRSHIPARGAEDAPRTIGLGFSLYGMQSLELGAAIKALAEIGYDCTELPVMPDWPGDSARLGAAAQRELRMTLARFGVRLTALMENLPATGDDAQHRANLVRLQRAADLARALAPEQPTPGHRPRPLIETILGGRPGEFEAVKERLADRLRAWAKVGAAAEVAIAVKAHVSNGTQRPEQLAWVVDQVASPWLRAAYDYSHFELQGLEMKGTADALLPKSAFIHVKDTRHSQGKSGFLLPGDGTTDYVALGKLIQQSVYRGDIVVEVSNQVSNQPGYEPLAAASKCYAVLADALAKAGVRRG
jgi:sugar phosphate isomerase/epimerase